MVSYRIVIIAATITIVVAGAVVYAVSSSGGGSKSDPLREQGANCPALRPLSEAGDVHQSTELGKYIGELRAVKAPQVFEGASKSVADEFQRLSAVTEEDARKVVDELQTATSLDSPSPRTTLFLALLHRVAEERKRLDAVTSSISTTSSTIASIVANAENTYLNGSRSNEELCAMNAVHHYAAQLRDHLAAVTLSATTATAAAQQHYATTIPWNINGTYQNYPLEDIYHAYHQYTQYASEALLNTNIDDIVRDKKGCELSWWYIGGGVLGSIVLVFVFKFLRNQYYNARSLWNVMKRSRFMFKMGDIQDVKEKYRQSIPYYNTLLQELDMFENLKQQLLFSEDDLNDDCNVAIKKIIYLFHFFNSKILLENMMNSLINILHTQIKDNVVKLDILMHLMACNFSIYKMIEDEKEYCTALFIINYFVFCLPTIYHKYLHVDKKDTDIWRYFKGVQGLAFIGILHNIAVNNYSEEMKYASNEIMWVMEVTDLSIEFFDKWINELHMLNNKELIEFLEKRQYSRFNHIYTNLITFVTAVVTILHNYGYSDSDPQEKVNLAISMLKKLDESTSS